VTDIRRTHGSGNQARCFRDDHDPWREILRAREAAHAKHGANSIESIPVDSPMWLPILVEEVGELAHCLTYDGPKTTLRAEVVDVLAVASALLAAIDAEGADR
jgi:NTP pyrophosphatase (non-canonical NTP hydrolase)